MLFAVIAVGLTLVTEGVGGAGGGFVTQLVVPQVLPVAQLAVAEMVFKSTALLYR